MIRSGISSSTTSMNLPSTTTFTETLKGFLDPVTNATSFETTKLKWKQLCLDALSYGTDYSDYALRSRRMHEATTGHQQQQQQQQQQPQPPTLKLKFRASKTLTLFIDVMMKYDADIAAANLLARDRDVPTNGVEDAWGKHLLYLQRVDPAKVILADSLWMVGQMLLPPEPVSTITKSSSGPKQDDTTGDKDMVHAGNTNTGPQFLSSINPEEEEMLREESMSAFTYIVQGLSGMKMDPKVSPHAFANPKLSTLPAPILPPHLLQMLLDPYQLSRADIVPHEQFIRKYRKYQTNILYRQRRFNLLVEESEGWAKILTLLSSLPSVDEDNCNSSDVLEQLRGYIGAFDLDPNRLLSVLLDVLELELDRTIQEIRKERFYATVGQPKDPPVGNKTLNILLDLMDAFKLSALPHLLGFKLQYLSSPQITNINSTTTTSEIVQPQKKPLQEHDDADNPSASKDGGGRQSIVACNPVPLSFFQLCAFLVSHQIVSLEELYPYFAPRLDTTDKKLTTTKKEVPGVQPTSSARLAPLLLEEWTKMKQKDIAQDVRSWGLISLNASNTPGTEAKISDVDPSDQSSIIIDSECPVLILLETLLSFGCWDSFTYLLELCHNLPPPPISSTPTQQNLSPPTVERTRPSLAVVDVILLRPSIGMALCEFLHHMLDYWYHNGHRSPPCLWIGKTEVSDTMIRPLGMLPGKKPKVIEPYKGYMVKRFNQLITSRRTTGNVYRFTNEENNLIDKIFEPVMLLASSHEAVLDATLYLKLCTLFTSYLEKQRSMNEDKNFLSVKAKSIFQQYLLPSLPLYPTNPQLLYGLWTCLQLLPFTIRYSLYDAWANGPRSFQSRIGVSFLLERNAVSKTALLGNGCSYSDKQLWAVRTEVMAGKETRSVLKRLSKETIREQTRRFAKVSSASPIIAFSILIQQMQAYDNMIDLMVDSFQLCSDLSRDVLVWCLLQNLASVDDGKLDTSSSQLLTSIETFTGILYRTFPHLEIKGILDWLLNGLIVSGPISSLSLSGLGVIRSLITTAGGLELVGGDGGAVSSQQLEGLAGSQLLKRETISFGVVDKVNSVASASLLFMLLSSGKSAKTNNVGIALLIRLAQLRLKVLFDPNLKMKDVMKLGKIYDSIQTTMMLLLEFLSCPRDWNESEAQEVLITYASNVPPLDTLIDQNDGYGIDSAAAFAIVRPCIRAALMAEGQMRRRQLEIQTDTSERGESMHVGESVKKDDLDIPQPYKRWLPDSPGILDVCSALIPKSFQSTISCTLYCTFWTLDLFDLYVPKQRYVTEVNRLNKEEERLLKQRRSAPSEAHKFTAKDAAELQRVMKNAKKLKDDELKQADHSKFVESTFFDSNIKIFFPPFPLDVDHMDVSLNICNALDRSYAKAFLTVCVFPRSLTSPDSAFYCAQFVLLLHNTNTPRFSTLQFFDYIIKATPGALMYLTEEEAQNFGILLESLWSIITDWRYGKDETIDAEAAYERDVMTKEGCILEAESAPVTYEQYKILYSEWHNTLSKAFLGCLEAKAQGVDSRLTNLRVRSGINILTRLVRAFPTRPDVGERLFKRLKILQEDESRPETKAMANAYVAQLTKAMLEGCWKEQTATEKREWEEQQLARAEGRKKRAEQTQKEMAAENARIDKITDRRDSRGRGDALKSGREWERSTDRSTVEEKRSPPNNQPETNLYNAPVESRDRTRLEKERERDSERDYRDKDRFGDKQRSADVVTDPDRRMARGWNSRARTLPSTQPSASSGKVVGSGLEGRWHGTSSNTPQLGKTDRESGSKRGRSPSESKIGPPEKKSKSEDNRGRVHQLHARPGRYDSVGRSEPGRRY